MFQPLSIHSFEPFSKLKFENNNELQLNHLQWKYWQFWLVNHSKCWTICHQIEIEDFVHIDEMKWWRIIWDLNNCIDVFAIIYFQCSRKKIGLIMIEHGWNSGIQLTEFEFIQTSSPLEKRPENEHKLCSIDYKICSRRMCTTIRNRIENNHWCRTKRLYLLWIRSKDSFQND